MYIACFVLHTCLSSGHSHGKLVGMDLNNSMGNAKVRDESFWSWERSIRRHSTKNYAETVKNWIRFLSMCVKQKKPATKLTENTKPKWKTVVAAMLLTTMNSSLCYLIFQISAEKTYGKILNRVLNRTWKKIGSKVLIPSSPKSLTYQISCLKIIRTFWVSRAKVVCRKNCDFWIKISK